MSLRGLAAKAETVLVHVPNGQELAAHPNVCKLAMTLVRDVVRIGWEGGTSKIVDPIYAAIAASREAQAA